MSHPDVDALYYLDNFHYLIDWLSKRYEDLLSEAERTLIERFRQLSAATQALLVRLIMRKGVYFRLGKLSYPEIEANRSLVSVVDELEATGFVSSRPSLALEDLFTLFRRDELETFLPKQKGVTKSQWLEALSGHPMKCQPVSAWAPAFNECVIELRNPSVYEYLKLIFFGNMRQDFSEFVLADLGLNLYETVDFDQDSRGFHERADIEAYMRLHAIQLYLNECLEESKHSPSTRWQLEYTAYSPSSILTLSQSVPNVRIEGDHAEKTVEKEVLISGMALLEYLRANHAPMDHAAIQSVLLTPIAAEWIDQRRHRMLFKYAEAAARYGTSQYSAHPEAQQCSTDRGGECEYSLFLYERCEAPGAHVKWLRLLERLQRREEAYQRVCAALQSPRSEEEEQQLGRIYRRLAKRFGPVVNTDQAIVFPGSEARTSDTQQYNTVKTSVSAKSLSVKSVVADSNIDVLNNGTDHGKQSFDDRPCSRPPGSFFELSLPRTSSVEQSVATALSTSEAPVFYVENLLVNALFGLLFWDAIFAPVQGAFFHPFHSGPVDLFRPDFIEKRRALFDQGLAAIDDGRYKAMILSTFEHKQGVLSPFVFWAGLSKELVMWALECIPAEHLRLWCQWLMQDLKRNRTGFADLIQFCPGRSKYRMIEVKGPGDRLQDNQLRMIAYAQRHELPIEVCWVNWLPDDENASPDTLTVTAREEKDACVDEASTGVKIDGHNDVIADIHGSVNRAPAVLLITDGAA